MKVKVLLVLVLLLQLLSGCSNEDKKQTHSTSSNSSIEQTANETKKTIYVTGDEYPLTIRDCLDYETVLDKPFTRAAVLSGTPLNIWYDLGGKSVCTSDVSSNVKLVSEYAEEILNLPDIGPVYSVNMESVIGHRPDFVVAQVGTQGTQAKKLRDMGFKVITTNIRSFEDVLDVYEAFGKLLNNEEKAKEKIEYLMARKNELVAKAPKNGDSIVILYIAGSSLAAKLNNSIAGDIANMLGLDNVVKDLPPDTIGSEHTPLDVEYLVKKNPDFVLVTSMLSSNTEAKKIMEKEFARNPIWKGVRAIQEGNVIYLPQEYFLFNAGPHYDEAIEYMAMSIYPNIFGKVEEKYECR